MASLLDAQQQGQANSELIVRLLDAGQGDATYIANGASRVIIDGGPSTATFGRSLDFSISTTPIAWYGRRRIHDHTRE